MDFIQAILHNTILKNIGPGEKLVTQGNTTLLTVGKRSVEFVFTDSKIELTYKDGTKTETKTYKNIKSFLEGFNGFICKFGFNSRLGTILSLVNLDLTLGSK